MADASFGEVQLSLFVAGALSARAQNVGDIIFPYKMLAYLGLLVGCTTDPEYEAQIERKNANL